MSVAQIAGYAALQIIPSLQAIGSNLTDQVKKPLAQAGEQAGKASGNKAGASFTGTIKSWATTAATTLGAVSVAKFAKDSVAAFQSWAGQVNAMKRATGDTAEGASRLAFAMKNAAVNVNIGQAGLARFSKTVGLAAGDTKKAAALQSMLGTSIFDASGKVKTMSQLLPDIATKYNALGSQAEKNALVSTLFGKAAGPELSKLLSKGGDGLQALMTKSDQYGQTVSESQLKANAAAAQASRDLKQAWEGLKIQLGASLMPAMGSLTSILRDSLVPAITGALGAFNSMDPGMRTALVSAIGLMIGMAPILSILRQFAPIIALVRGAFSLFGNAAVVNAAKSSAAWVASGARTVASWVASSAAAVASGVRIGAVWAVQMTAAAVQGAASFAVQAGRVVAGWVLMGVQSLIQGARMAAGWVLAMGPIGWIITAVVALVVLIIANWQQISAVTMAVFGAIGSFFTTVWTNIVNFVRGALIGYGLFIIGTWRNISNFTTSIFSAIGSFFTNLWNGIINFGRNALIGFGLFILGAWRNISNFTSSIWSGISGFFSGIWSNLTRGVSNTIGGIVGFFTSLPGKIGDALAGAGSWLLESGKSIVQGLFNGISSLAGSIGDFFLKLLPGWIVGPFKAALGIASPSKLFTSFGMNIGQGIVNGAVAMGSKIKDTMKSLVTVPALPDVDLGAVRLRDNPTGGAGSAGSGTSFYGATPALGGGSGPAVNIENMTVNQGDENTAADIADEIDFKARSRSGGLVVVG